MSVINFKDKSQQEQIDLMRRKLACGQIEEVWEIVEHLLDSKVDACDLLKSVHLDDVLRAIDIHENLIDDAIKNSLLSKDYLSSDVLCSLESLQRFSDFCSRHNPVFAEEKEAREAFERQVLKYLGIEAHLYQKIRVFSDNIVIYFTNYALSYSGLEQFSEALLKDSRGGTKLILSKKEIQSAMLKKSEHQFENIK